MFRPGSPIIRRFVCALYTQLTGLPEEIFFIKMTNDMQLSGMIYYSIIPWMLYMFQAILSLIIRNILTVIAASVFIHMY